MLTWHESAPIPFQFESNGIKNACRYQLGCIIMCKVKWLTTLQSDKVSRSVYKRPRLSRILVVTGAYVPSAGGAEYSLHETLQYLRSLGFQVRVITASCKRRDKLRFDNIVVAPLEAPGEVIRRQVATWMPDIIFTQLLWSDWILSHKRILGIPVVYFARNVGGNLDLSPGRHESPDLIVANCEDTRRSIKSEWGCDSLVLHPVVLDARFCYQDAEPRHLHFMLNPLLIKGGDQFCRVAEARPQLKFATIFGWDQYRLGPSSNASWDPKVVKILEKARNKKITTMPTYANLNHISNISVLALTENMHEVYARLRVLLLPSRWREAVSRVLVEAAACGVPSIVSLGGGVSEGPYLEEYALPPSAKVGDWVCLLDKLQNEFEWSQASERIQEKYNHYRCRLVKELNTLAHELTRLVHLSSKDRVDDN